MLPYSYIGSCRYEHVFQNVYPGRFHSVREINYFLENLNNLKNYFSYSCFSNPVLKTFVNLTFGNVFNNYLKNKTFSFPYHLDNFLKSKFLYIEISSLRYASTNCGIIANKHFLKTRAKEMIHDYLPNEIFDEKLFVLKKDDYAAIEKVIMKMLEILKLRTQIKKIFLIPHVNLISKKTQKKINSRQEIDLIIEKLTKKFEIFEKVDIWESIEIKNYYQEDILDSDYFHLNDLGENLVFNYFHNEFKKNQENKSYINLNTDPAIELRG